MVTRCKWVTKRTKVNKLGTSTITTWATNKTWTTTNTVKRQMTNNINKWTTNICSNRWTCKRRRSSLSSLQQQATFPKTQMSTTKCSLSNLNKKSLKTTTTNWTSTITRLTSTLSKATRKTSMIKNKKNDLATRISQWKFLLQMNEWTKPTIRTYHMV